MISAPSIHYTLVIRTYYQDIKQRFYEIYAQKTIKLAYSFALLILHMKSEATLNVHMIYVDGQSMYIKYSPITTIFANIYARCQVQERWTCSSWGSTTRIVVACGAQAYDSYLGHF